MTPHRLLPVFALLLLASPAFAQPKLEPADFLLPDESKMTPFKDRVPMVFVTSNQPEWKSLQSYWTESTQADVDPTTGLKVARKVVKLKVPLGLTQAPVVPAENPMTVEKWVLGKKLYFDKILSTNGTVACATCHAPDKGFSDAKRTSTG